MEQNRYWEQRSICDVLEEIRKCYETRNFSPLLGLIEEAQIMANRMEAALGQGRDLVRMNEEWHALRKAIDELRDLSKPKAPVA